MPIARKRTPPDFTRAPNTLRCGGALLWRRPASTHAPDAPAPTGGFTLSVDEFITGTPKESAQNIIEQCRAVGAGHFLTVLNWSAPFEEVAQAHELFGREVIPFLRR